jgi:hypothetical protein
MSDGFIHDPVYSAIIWTLILSNKYSIETWWMNFNIWGLFKSITNILKKLLP